MILHTHNILKSFQVILHLAFMSLFLGSLHSLTLMSTSGQFEQVRKYLLLSTSSLPFYCSAGSSKRYGGSSFPSLRMRGSLLSITFLYFFVAPLGSTTATSPWASSGA
jgi:hypothetical protein